MGLMDKQVEKLNEKAQELVGPGEQVHTTIVGMGRNPYLTGGGLLGFFLGKWRGLVVTDHSVKLLSCVSTANPSKGFTTEIASVPRGTDIGALKGINAKLTFPNGEKVYVSRVHFGRLRDALA
jgi:hypothetical protein